MPYSFSRVDMKKKKTNFARGSGDHTREIPPYVRYGLVFLIILLVALIRIRLLDCPLERDEGEYAYAGQLILQGVPPYQLAYNMKLPGTYAAYALILAVFGQTPSAVHLGVLLVNAGTTIIVYLLAAYLLGSFAGIVACSSFALMSLSPSVLGFAGHATHFVLLPAMGGLLLLVKAIKERRVWMLLWSGLLLGLSFVMKQPGIFFVLFAVALYSWSELRTRPLSWRRFSVRGSLLVLGTIAPFGITCLVLRALGVFDRFWFWTFSYAREYATHVPVSIGFQNFFSRAPNAVEPSILIWIIAGVGLVALFWLQDFRPQKPFLLGLLFFSFLSVCPGLIFRQHYFILMLPVVALMAGLAMEAALRYLQRTGQPRVLATLAFVVVLGVSILQLKSFLFEMTPFEVCRASYGANPFPESLEIARYIRDHTAEGDRIAVIGSEPEIYFYSRRHSATGYIYTYGLMEEQKYASQMQKEMIKEIETARPKYMVLVNVEWSWLMEPNADQTIFSWFDQFASTGYALDGIVDILSEDQTVYHWGDEARSYQPQSNYNLMIFKRTRP